MVSKKDIAIDTVSAVAISSITDPKTALGAVTAIALATGLSKYFLDKRRDVDLEKLAERLSETETAKAIKKMDERKFLDDLYYSIEKIMRQRSDSKRILMQKVFLGYINTEYKSSYPLEKMYAVVESLTFADVSFFRRVFEAKDIKEKYSFPFVSTENLSGYHVPEEEKKKLMILTYSEATQDQASKESLIAEGLLIERNEGVGGIGAAGGTPQIYVTHFGKYFKEYLLNLEDL